MKGRRSEHEEEEEEEKLKGRSGVELEGRYRRISILAAASRLARKETQREKMLQKRKRRGKSPYPAAYPFTPHDRGSHRPPSPISLSPSLLNKSFIYIFVHLF